ncbi:MAG: choice-of-anchor Q domain-containing protein, partial [Bacteroidota bacterium]
MSSIADDGPGSLRDAVRRASEGDSILFDVQGEIFLDSQIVINKSIGIFGPGADILEIKTIDSTRLILVEKNDTVYIDKLSFADGNATGYDPPYGGAISNNGVLTVKECNFHDNRATSGGAIENQAFGTTGNFLKVENCSFYHNLAIQPIPGFIEFGGAIYADARNAGETAVEIINSTFAENQAKISGGAIYLVGDAAGGAKLSMSNSTVAYNSVEGRCGGIDISQAEAVSLKNTLIANNQGRADIPDIFGAMLSGGNNLIADTSSSLVLVNAPATDLFEIEANLGPFGLNSGIFPTVSLACGSPAIDAGDDAAAPNFDLRGQARVGTSDIGAYERNEAED